MQYHDRKCCSTLGNNLVPIPLSVHVFPPHATQGSDTSGLEAMRSQHVSSILAYGCSRIEDSHWQCQLAMPPLKLLVPSCDYTCVVAFEGQKIISNEVVIKSAR